MSQRHRIFSTVYLGTGNPSKLEFGRQFVQYLYFARVKKLTINFLKIRCLKDIGFLALTQARLDIVFFISKSGAIY